MPKHRIAPSEVHIFGKFERWHDHIEYNIMIISKISPGTSLASSTASAAAWKTFSPCSSRSDSLQVLLLNINHCAFSRCIIFNFLFRALPQQNGSSSLWGVRCLLKIKFYFFRPWDTFTLDISWYTLTLAIHLDMLWDSRLFCLFKFPAWTVDNFWFSLLTWKHLSKRSLNRISICCHRKINYYCFNFIQGGPTSIFIL